MNSWQEDLQEWINNQHGTAGWEQKLENFIQSILDRKAKEIEGLKKLIKHPDCVREYEHCECHDWEKENDALDQAISILKEE